MASVEGKNETKDIEMDYDTPGSKERESQSGTASDHDSSITFEVERQIRQEQGKVW